VLFFLAEIPFQVFFLFSFPLFFRGFFIWSQLLSQFHQFLLRHGQSAAFADVVLGAYHVLHFAAAFWAIWHVTHLVRL
jgi:hypothetical protein